MSARQSVSVILLSFMLFFLALQTQAAAYKCVNPDGGTEYIDLPKEGYTCTEVRTVPAPTPVAAPSEQAPGSDNADNASSADQSEANAETDARQANCETARSNLAILQGDQDVVVTDQEGNKTLLNAEQRQTELSKAQKDVDYWCSTE